MLQSFGSNRKSTLSIGVSGGAYFRPVLADWRANIAVVHDANNRTGIDSCECNSSLALFDSVQGEVASRFGQYFASDISGIQDYVG
jgi:hypothetical protein